MDLPSDPFDDDDHPLSGHELFETSQRAKEVLIALGSAGSFANAQKMLEALPHDDLRALGAMQMATIVRDIMRATFEGAGQRFDEDCWRAWLRAPDTTATLDEMVEAWEDAGAARNDELSYEEVLAYLRESVEQEIDITIAGRADGLPADMTCTGILTDVGKIDTEIMGEADCFAIGAARLLLSPDTFRYAEWSSSILAVHTTATTICLMRV